MRKHRIIRILVLFLCFLVVLGAVAHWLGREPSYQGRTVSQWAADLESNDPSTSKRALAALEAMGPEAVEWLSRAVEQRPSRLRNFYSKVGSKAPPMVKNLARRVLGSRDTDFDRFKAVRVLRAMGSNAAGAAPVLGGILREPHAVLSQEATYALSEIGPEALPELIGALREENYHTRKNACIALQRMGPGASNAIPQLVELIRKDNGLLTPTLTMTLACIGEAGLPALTNLLSNEAPSVRSAVCQAMTFLGSSAAVPALLAHDADPDPEVRQVRIRALGTCDRTNRLVDSVLVRALGDGAGPVRAAAVEAIGARPRVIRNHLEKITEMLEERDAKVVEFAAYALGQAGHRASNAIPALRRLANSPEPAVSNRVAGALRVIGEDMAIRR